MKRPKVYIAGKYTGIEEAAEKMFNSSECRLEKAGFEVINPLGLVPKYTSWKDSMDKLLPEVKKCDAIALLPNWKDSIGASLEYKEALKHNLLVIFL